MKKLFYILSSILMTCGMAACSGSEDLPEVPQNSPVTNQTYKINLNIGGAATRTALLDNEADWIWKANDQLVLTKNGQYICMLKLQGTEDENVHDAVFEGISPVEIFVDQDYMVTYMGAGNNLNKDDMTFAVDFSKQNGTKEGLGNCDVMSTIIQFSKDFTNNVYYNKVNKDLEKVLSVAHFEFKGNKEGENVTAKTAVQGTGVYSSIVCQINASDVTIKSKTAAGTTNPLTFSSNLTSDIYLTFVPGEIIAPVFKRTYADNSFVYGTPGKTSEALKAGYIYRGAEKDGSIDATKGVPVPMDKSSLEEVDEQLKIVNWVTIETKDEHNTIKNDVLIGEE